MKLYLKLFIVCGALTLGSCFDDPGTEIVWGKDAYLELDRAGQPNPTSTNTFQRLNNGTTYPLNVQVNLMGRPRDTDTNVTFEIEAGSTAIEGVHYTKVTPGTSITIPAGQNIANIQFTVIADAIPTGAANQVSMIINLTGGDVPLSKYVRATYNLRTTP
jgi:hypothetical protein